MSFISAKAYFSKCLHAIQSADNVDDELRKSFEKSEKKSLYNGLVHLTAALEDLEKLIKNMKK